MALRASWRRDADGHLVRYHSTDAAGLSAYAPPSDGMVLYLKAGVPGSGTAWTDQSGNGLNGTLINGATWGTDEVVLDTDNDCVSVADNALMRGMAGLSLLVWARKDTNDLKLAAKWSGGSKQYIFREDSDTFMFRINNEYGSETSLYGGGGTSGLHFYAAVYNGSDMLIYKDAVDVAVQLSATSGAISNGSGVPTYIGAEYDQSWAFGGGIARVLIYDRGLSESEILAIHAGFPLS